MVMAPGGNLPANLPGSLKPGAIATDPLTTPVHSNVTVIQFAGGSSLYSGTGAPATTLGVIGDFYLRNDTPATVNQRIYIKTGASAWTGIV